MNLFLKARLGVLFCLIVVPDVWAFTFPDASTTGVPPGVQLTPSGPVAATQEGQIIENLSITGTLTIKANNVTVRNCRIDANGNSFGIDNRFFGILVEDTEVTGAHGAGVYSMNPATLRRLYIHGNVDGIKLSTGNTVEDCFITDTLGLTNSHPDGIQIREGDHIIIRHNRIEGRYQNSTSAVFISSGGARPLHHITVEDNLLSGGAFTFYGPADGTYITVKNNIWVKNSWQFGPKRNHSPDEGWVWIGNSLDDGTPLLDANETPHVTSPRIVPRGGTFAGQIQVTLEAVTSGSAIFYTLDGSAPSTQSTSYTGPFTISSSLNVNAIAVKNGMLNSLLSSAVFTLDGNPLPADTVPPARPGTPRVVNQ